MSFVFTRALRVVADSTISSKTARKTGRARKGRTAAKRAIRAAVEQQAILEPLEDRTFLSTTYYVSTSGSDSNKGTSSSSPWKDISKINATTLHPGDSVLFEGGETFYGALTFGTNDGGSSTAVTIGSYGSGKATINSGGSDGAFIKGTNGLTITNLNFVGSETHNQSHSGIVMDVPGGATESNITISNCNVSGYDYAGIQTDGAGKFTNVSITSNTVHDNWLNGIMLSSGSEYSDSNAYIAYNTVYNNAGSTSVSSISGSGINAANLANGTIQYNVSYNNGTSGEGGCGIWICGSNDTTVQYNISHDNKTAASNDGDGFDMDLDTKNSVMQYNYSYNNDGAGFMFDQWQGNGKFQNNIIRYNISQNDGRKNGYAGLSSFGQVANSQMYNNAVYMTGSNSQAAGILVKYSALGGSYATGLKFENNIIVTGNNHNFVSVASNEVHGSNLVFSNNDYYAVSGTSDFVYGSTYTTLAKWSSATGQEKAGMQTNPDLVNAGGAPALSSASSLYTLTAYDLTSSSPLINKGTVVSSNGGKDFFGDSVSSSAAPSIGPDQYTGKVTTTPSGSSSSGSSSSSSSSGSSSSGSSSSGSSSSSSSSSLPSGWSSIDIGSVGKAGSASYSSGTYTITGSGSDFSGTADSFHYVYSSLNGNGTIIAEVTSESDPNSSAKAGIMLRDGINPGDKEVSVSLAPGGVVHFDSRTTENGTTSYSSLSGFGSTVWLELVRSGSTITAYASKDDKTWTKLGSAVKTMSTTLEAGLAVTAHDAGVIETAKFSSVSISSSTSTPSMSSSPAATNTATLPSGWTSADIGSTGATGNATYSNGTFSVTGSGADITGTSDAFHYVYTTLNGNGSIVAEVSNVGDVNSAAKAGLMFRDGTGANAKEVSLSLAPDDVAHYDDRTTTGGNTSYGITGTLSSTEWLKLTRNGNTITSYVSSNGTTWTEVSSTTLTLDATLEVGLDVTSHDAGALESANFSNVSVS